MEKLKLLTNLDLKLSTDIVPSRREFHRLIVCGKKENIHTYIHTYILYWISSLSRALPPSILTTNYMNIS